MKAILFNQIIQTLLENCEEKLEGPEKNIFTMACSPPSLGVLQVRPTVITPGNIVGSEQDLSHPDALVVSVIALRNRLIEDILNVVCRFSDQFQLEKNKNSLANWK